MRQSRALVAAAVVSILLGVGVFHALSEQRPTEPNDDPLAYTSPDTTAPARASAPPPPPPSPSRRAELSSSAAQASSAAPSEGPAQEAPPATRAAQAALALDSGPEAAQGWIVGRALDPKGKGVPQATVTLRGFDEQTLEQIPEGMRDMWLAQVETMGPEVMGHMIKDLRSVKTDAEGHFKLQGPAEAKLSHWLRLAHEDYVPVMSKSFRESLRAPVEVTLVRGGTLEVEVRSPAGEVLPEAQVKLALAKAAQESPKSPVRSKTLKFDYDLSQLQSQSLELSATAVATLEATAGEVSDEAAIAPATAPAEPKPQVFEGVPPGQLEVRADAQGYQAQSETLVLASGERRQLTIRLGVGLTLRGRVQDAAGAPVAEASVQGYAMDGRQVTSSQTATAADGSFTLTGLNDSDYYLSVAASGFDSSSGRQTHRPGPEPVVITLARTYGVRGRVVLASGEAAEAGLQVQVRSQDKRYGATAMGNTAEDGSFEVQGLPPGRYQVAVEGAGLTTLDPVPVRIQEDFVTGLEVEVARGSTASFVVSTGGQPLEGAKVELRPDLEAMSFRSASGLDSSPATDAGGRLSWPGLAPGEQTFFVSKEGYAKAEVVVVVEAGRDPAPVRVTLVGGATLEARVLQADGEPYASKTVMIVAKGADFESPEAFQTMAATDSEGRFSKDGLSEGTYVLQAMNFGSGQTGGLRSLGEVRLQPAQTTRVELRLSPAKASVSGVVIRGGQPKPGVQVSVYREGALMAGFSQATTDEAGRFSVKDLEAGTYVVSSDGARETLRLRDEVPAEVRLEVKAGTVSGRVLDAQGRPAAKARLAILALDEGTFEEAFRPQHEADALGSFQLENVRPGRYRLLATLPGGGATQGLEFELAAEEARTGLELQLGRGGSLDLDLTYADGKPAAGAQVALFHVELGVFRTQLEGWNAAKTPVADRQGHVSLTNLIPGTYVLLATSATQQLGVLQGVSVGEGGGAQGRIALAPGGGLEIEAPPGSSIVVRVAGTEVPLGGTGTPMAKIFGAARTGPAGTLSLGGLPSIELEVTGHTSEGRALSTWRGKVVAGDARVVALR